ncbi:MAG TPA: hypothetical protein PKE65_07885, partial [Rhizobiaceae bacterium]|nr:hypothetical protein [Rhizobiaceae bacterium]
MILSLLSLLLAAALAVLGVLFLVNPKMAFALSAHEPQALPAVMGGRYLGLAAIVVGLVIMADWPALALAFAIGTGL